MLREKPLPAPRWDSIGRPNQWGIGLEMSEASEALPILQEAIMPATPANSQQITGGLGGRSPL
jgi:hypothetical protein